MLNILAVGTVNSECLWLMTDLFKHFYYDQETEYLIEKKDLVVYIFILFYFAVIVELKRFTQPFLLLFISSCEISTSQTLQLSRSGFKFHLIHGRENGFHLGQDDLGANYREGGPSRIFGYSDLNNLSFRLYAQQGFDKLMALHCL